MLLRKSDDISIENQLVCIAYLKSARRLVIQHIGLHQYFVRFGNIRRVADDDIKERKLMVLTAVANIRFNPLYRKLQSCAIQSGNFEGFGTNVQRPNFGISQIFT